MMESLWADLRTGDRTPRTREEIDAEIDALRNEAEEEMQAVERLQEEYRAARSAPSASRMPASRGATTLTAGGPSSRSEPRQVLGHPEEDVEPVAR
jgi:hypothetical protein